MPSRHHPERLPLALFEDLAPGLGEPLIRCLVDLGERFIHSLRKPSSVSSQQVLGKSFPVHLAPGLSTIAGKLLDSAEEIVRNGYCRLHTRSITASTGYQNSLAGN